MRLAKAWMRAPARHLFATLAGALVCVVLAAPAAATFPGDNGRLAYVKHRLFWTEGGSDEPPELDSFPHIWTMNPDGSSRRRFAGFAEEPRFSPGGGVVAFQDYLERIFVKAVSAGRGEKDRVAPRLRGVDPQLTPGWSPSGQRLIFALARFEPRTGLYLHTIGRDGARLRRVRAGIEPDWSIRNRIVFESRARIATMAPGGARLRRLGAGFTPRWSPDGQWIVFTRALPGGRRGIAIMRENGSGKRLLTSGPWDGSPVWSPDGRKIAYVHRNRRKAREKVVVMRRDGEGRRAILTVRRHPRLFADASLLEDLDWQPLVR